MDYGYGWIEILGFISGGIGLSVAVPQLVKILKAQSHVGVSISAWVLMMCNYACWLGFSFRMDSPSQLISNVIAVFVTSLLVFVLLKEQWGNGFISVLFISLLVFACIWLVNVLPVFWMDVLLIIAIGARFPQLFTSYKSWRLGRHTNVSLLTYMLMALSSLGWMVYGIVSGLYMNILSSGVGLVISMVVLFFEVEAEKKYVKNQQ